MRWRDEGWYLGEVGRKIEGIIVGDIKKEELIEFIRVWTKHAYDDGNKAGIIETCAGIRREVEEYGKIYTSGEVRDRVRKLEELVGG